MSSSRTPTPRQILHSSLVHPRPGEVKVYMWETPHHLMIGWLEKRKIQKVSLADWNFYFIFFEIFRLTNGCWLMYYNPFLLSVFLLPCSPPSFLPSIFPSICTPINWDFSSIRIEYLLCTRHRAEISKTKINDKGLGLWNFSVSEADR